MKNIFALIRISLLFLITVGMSQVLKAQSVGVSSVVITFESEPTATVTKAVVIPLGD